LLRSRYNYKTIEYESIEKATIKRGPEINNVIVVVVLGIGLVAFALFQSLYLIELLKTQMFTKSILSQLSYQCFLVFLVFI
jgi:hypothetical protein